MSAKELGQVHSLEKVVSVSSTDIGGVPQMGGSFDLAGSASDKLQRLIRQGNFFKLVGIDISLNNAASAPANASGSISGYFRYYAPTKGRCAAFRHAFKAMADQMQMQGIPMRQNKLYDFRVALADDPGILNYPIPNNSTMDGTIGLALNHSSVRASVFGVYNKSVQPTNEATAAADLFDEGFNTLLQSGGGTTDFVLNDTRLYSGNDDLADETYDRIPFSIHFGGGNATSFQWRPDPALYVAIMTGNLQMVIEDYETSAGQTVELEVSMMVSGWKSIMGNPDKKRSSKKRASRKGSK